MTLRDDHEFDADAPNTTAAAVYRFARELGPKVLDLGSGPAVVSSRLARELGFDVTCIDSDTDAIAAARRHGVGRTFVRDLTGPDWARDVRGESFDLIVLTDVLGRLPRPEDVLRAIGELGLLAPGGRLVVSIPNASHETVIASLLVDDLHYGDSDSAGEVGALDAAHVRWFTMKSMQRLLQSHGYSIETSAGITRRLDETSARHLRVDLDPALQSAILRQVPHAGVYEYVFVVAPLAESSAVLVARDDEVVREASALADGLVRDLAERQDVLEAELADRDQRIAELTTLLHEAREHALEELERAAARQTEVLARDKKQAATIARQKRELATARPYLRGRRLAGRVKRRLAGRVKRRLRRKST